MEHPDCNHYDSCTIRHTKGECRRCGAASLEYRTKHQKEKINVDRTHRHRCGTAFEDRSIGLYCPRCDVYTNSHGSEHMEKTSKKSKKTKKGKGAKAAKVEPKPDKDTAELDAIKAEVIKLHEEGHSGAEIGRRIGKSTQYVNALRRRMGYETNFPRAEGKTGGRRPAGQDVKRLQEALECLVTEIGDDDISAKVAAILNPPEPKPEKKEKAKAKKKPKKPEPEDEEIDDDEDEEEEDDEDDDEDDEDYEDDEEDLGDLKAVQPPDYQAMDTKALKAAAKAAGIKIARKSKKDLIELLEKQ